VWQWADFHKVFLVFTPQNIRPKYALSGGLAEWSNAPVLKTDEG